jgi:hypothetical protein
VLDVRSVRVTEWDARVDYVTVKTPKGVFVTKGQLSVEETRNPGCAGGCGQKTKSVDIVTTPKGKAVVVTVYEHCWNNPFPSDDPTNPIKGNSTYMQIAHVCMVDDAGSVDCNTFDISTTHTAYRKHEDDFESVPWKSPRTRRTTAAGDIVFE